MPCGYRDQRRRGHRCVNCRASHSKCDNSRPCRPCERLGLSCEEPQFPSSKVSIVEYRPPPKSQSIGPILCKDSWLYVRIFFDAIQISDSPLLAAFRFEEIGPMIQEKGLIFDAVTAVGATFAQQTHTGRSLSSAQRAEIRDHCSFFRRMIDSRMSNPSSFQNTTFLFSLQLLAFMELMTDVTGERWNQLIQQLRPLFTRQKSHSTATYSFNTSIFKFTRMSYAIHNITFNDKLFIDSTFTEVPESMPKAFGPQEKSSRNHPEHIDTLIQMLERWAYLNNRSVKWIRCMREEQACSASPPYSPSEGIAHEGLQIIDMACAFQQDIINVILQHTEAGPASGTQVGETMEPYYRWILTGLCRMFAAPEWLSRGWKLPVMPAELSNEQALIILNSAEKSVARVKLEAIFYGTVMSFVGGYLSSAGDRERVIKLLKSVEDRGFAVASAFEADLQHEWGSNKAQP